MLRGTISYKSRTFFAGGETPCLPSEIPRIRWDQGTSASPSRYRHIYFVLVGLTQSFGAFLPTLTHTHWVGDCFSFNCPSLFYVGGAPTITETQYSNLRTIFSRNIAKPQLNPLSASLITCGELKPSVLTGNSLLGHAFSWMGK